MSWAAVLLSCLLLLAPHASRAGTRSLVSNLANPAIGMNLLLHAPFAPALDEPYGLRFDHAEVGLVSAVDPYWSFSGNLSFTPGGAEPEEAFATSTGVPALQLKLGLIRGMFGKHGLTHVEAFPFVEPPVVMGSTIGEEGFKAAGVEAAWLTPLPWYGEITVGAYQPAGPDAERPLDLGWSGHGNVPALAHVRNLLDANQETTLELGVSGLSGIGTDDARHSAFGADLVVRNVPLRRSGRRGWIAQAEYLGRASSGSGARTTDADGWYASFLFRWSQRWWTGARVEDARHALTDVLTQAGGGAGRVRKTSVNAAWSPSEFSYLRAEWTLSRAVPDAGGAVLHDSRLLLQASFTIGAHPPHAY